VNGASVEVMERDETSARITLEDGRVFEAPLVVGADGRKSQCREMAGIPTYGWAYHQTAIVCTIKHELDHQNVAVEHFLPGGPFATLPMVGKRCSIVWTEKTDAANALLAMDKKLFTEMLQDKVADYLGDIKLLGERFAFPLQLQHAERYTSERLILVGDAAHGIHPIAGQGFNLGMGDIEALREELLRAASLGLDLGGPDLLRRFEKRRRFDNGNMVVMTDLLDRLFSNAVPPVQALRRAGLGAVQRIKPLKRFFMRTAMGDLQRKAG
ncbi:MAG TPA: FAD-dependent monooxygenase, partial [Alphaproteobacteria bacterium]|nr:FAD-dependent monooxygenase [Alphaproteobacteria bacterium]